MNVTDANTSSLFGGDIEHNSSGRFSKTFERLASNEQTHVGGAPFDLQQRKSPRAEVERLCQLLLKSDAHVVDNGQHSALGALLVRLVSDIFAFAPCKMLARSSQEEMHNPPSDGVQPTMNHRPFTPEDSVLGSISRSGENVGSDLCVSSTEPSISVEAQPAMVRRCMLTVSKPVFKAPMVSALETMI